MVVVERVSRGGYSGYVMEFGGGDRVAQQQLLLADFHLGARYRLIDRWFLWGEITRYNAGIGLSWYI